MIYQTRFHQIGCDRLPAVLQIYLIARKHSSSAEVLLHPFIEEE